MSIQWGIGGFQTIPAQKVEQTGYGDRKALIYSMKGMLEAIDIPSYAWEYPVLKSLIFRSKKRKIGRFVARIINCPAAVGRKSQVRGSFSNYINWKPPFPFPTRTKTGNFPSYGS